MSSTGFLADLRVAFRQLYRNRALALTSIAVLAFGLGVNTAVFSALYKVALKPLPYPKAGELVAVHNRFPSLHLDRMPASALDYMELRQHPELFSDAGVHYFLDLTRDGIERPHKINAIAITASMFRTLGIAPIAGRFFNAGEEQYHGPHAVIVSEAYWRGELGGDPDILHRSLQLDGEQYPIVGVMPASFQFPNAVTQMWTPITFSPDALKAAARQNHYLRMYARLAPGVTFDQAASSIERLSQTLAAEHPEDYPLDRQGWRLFLLPMARDDDGSLRRWIAILFASVVCLLLIVCSNVAGLLLVRSTKRQFELSVRMALGASRAAIARLVLMEAVILAAVGGAAALWIANLGVDLFTKYGPVGVVEIEAPVYWFGVAVTLAAGIVCGLYPAWSAASSDAIDSIKPGGSQRTASRSQQRWRQALIVGQVGIAMGLLVLGGLLTHSILRLLDVPLGFDAQNVLSAQTQLHGPRYKDPAPRVEFFRAVIDQAGRIPGVDAASACTLLPFGYGESGNTFEIVGKPKPSVEPFGSFSSVFPNYFAAMRIPLVRGRFFTDQDRAGSEKVVIVDQALANRYLPGEDPIGKQVQMPWGKFTIAGVVGNVKLTGLDVEEHPEIYFPAAQSSPTAMTIVIRSRLPQAAVIDSLNRIVSQVDNDEPVFDVQSLQSFVDRSYRVRRFVALLMAGFAIAGALLAAVGLYALLSYLANMRRREAGIRMVLGAGPGAIAWLMCSQGAMLVALGAVLGSVAAAGASRLVASQLFGTCVQDPAAWLTAVGLIGLAGFAASAIPAWRSARIDPAESLRSE